MKNIDGKILSSWLTRQTVLKKKKKLHNPVRCKLKEGRKEEILYPRERERDHDGKNIWLLVMKNRPCAKYIHVKPF